MNRKCGCMLCTVRLLGSYSMLALKTMAWLEWQPWQRTVHHRGERGPTLATQHSTARSLAQRVALPRAQPVHGALLAALLLHQHLSVHLLACSRGCEQQRQGDGLEGAACAGWAA